MFELDFSELVSLINESPGEMVHCSRIRSMFASRACHKATRIGDSLTKKQMKTVSNKSFFKSCTILIFYYCYYYLDC
jgi:DNA mismatch repair ATPase MutL